MVMKLHHIAGWPHTDSVDKPRTPNNRNFVFRFLIKPDDQNETIEEKQQRVSKYEYMQVCSVFI